MIIENFNKHFSTAGHAFLLATPTPANRSASPAATRPSRPSFSFTQIQTADVLKELQNMDPYKSAGLDNLDPLFLKLSDAIVATPITILFNLSYRPRSLKIGKLLRSSPSSKGVTPETQTVTDLYPSCPAYLKSSKAKLINRSLTISNPIVPSPLCNPASEPVTGAPQPRSRY